jgi:hypothetical protein
VNIAKAYLAFAEQDAGTNYLGLCLDECHEVLAVFQDQRAGPIVAMTQEVIARVEEIEERRNL